ncbi:MAG: DUF192 domain-containing protein [Dehalococcoidia bacterium]|jgi:hypothetical protein|nr:DUF192 domain-containing protein [Dehalococcoidia bacterium]
MSSRQTGDGATRVCVRNAQTHCLLAHTVEMARGRRARRRGLLGRLSLGADEALWIEPSRGIHTFGMRFPIDIVALNAGGIVVDVASQVKPWRVRLPRAGTVGVLELPAGRAQASRTRVGHQILFEASDDDPYRADDSA